MFLYKVHPISQGWRERAGRRSRIPPQAPVRAGFRLSHSCNRLYHAKFEAAVFVGRLDENLYFTISKYEDR